MKKTTNGIPRKLATALEEVVQRVCANADLSDTRKRDLRSAVVVYGKIVGAPLSEIPLDLGGFARRWMELFRSRPKSRGSDGPICAAISLPQLPHPVSSRC